MTEERIKEMKQCEAATRSADRHEQNPTDDFSLAGQLPALVAAPITFPRVEESDLSVFEDEPSPVHT